MLVFKGFNTLRNQKRLMVGHHRVKTPASVPLVILKKRGNKKINTGENWVGFEPEAFFEGMGRPNAPFPQRSNSTRQEKKIKLGGVAGKTPFSKKEQKPRALGVYSLNKPPQKKLPTTFILTRVNLERNVSLKGPLVKTSGSSLLSRGGPREEPL